jgi:hypothetical protein
MTARRIVPLTRTSLRHHHNPIGRLLLRRFIRTRFLLPLGRLCNRRRIASWTGSTSKSRISFTRTSNWIVREFSNSKSRNTPGSPSSRRMRPKNSKSSNSIKHRPNNYRNSTRKSRNSSRQNSSRNARTRPSLKRRRTILQRTNLNRALRFFVRRVMRCGSATSPRTVTCSKLGLPMPKEFEPYSDQCQIQG